MKKHAIALVAASLLGGIYSTAQAEEFRLNNIYVIGDSLSDPGAFSQFAGTVLGSQGVPPQAIPNRIKFTTNGPNAPVWNQALGSKLGITVDVNRITAPTNPQNNQTIGSAIKVGGTNYAEGGARVALPNPVSSAPGNNPAEDGVTALSAVTQIDRMLADLQASGKNRFNQNDLVVVWAGSNDVLVNTVAVGAGQATVSQASTAMLTAAGQLVGQIDRLKAAGATNIVVVSLPDVSLTPQFAASGPQAQALGKGLGDAFNGLVEAGAAQRGAVVIRSSQLIDAVLADPARYGLTAPNATTVPACGTANGQFNTSLFCVQGVNASADSEQRLFADGIHPTAAVHQMLADAAFAGLQAAAANGAMVAAPLTPIRQHALSLENRLSIYALAHQNDAGQMEARPVGHKEWYGGVEGGRFESDAQQIQQGLDSNTIVTKLGMDTMLAPNWLLGGGVSIDQASTDFDNNAGGFDTDLFLVSGFTTIALSKQFYLNGAVAIGQIKYDTERKFLLGPSQERYTASPRADYSSIRVGGGYVHSFANGWSINPQLAYTVEEIDLDGYTESSGAASLSFGSTEYKARRVSYGLAVTKKPTGKDSWIPMLRVSFEDDTENDPVRIRMGPDASTLGTIEAPRPDGTFQLVTLSIGRHMWGGLLNFHVAGTYGMNGVNGTTFGVAYKAAW